MRFEQVYQREILFSLALARASANPMQHIREVIPVIPITAAQFYQDGDWRIHAAAVGHGHQLGFTQAEWPCLGYRIEVDGISIVISGDTIACESLLALARNADVLVQCCYLPDTALNTPARQLLSKLVIATSGQVGKIASEAGVKLWSSRILVISPRTCWLQSRVMFDVILQDHSILAKI